MSPLPLPPLGPNAHLRAVRNAELDRHNAETMIRIAQETGDTPLAQVGPGTLPGDELALRGIPAIGRNVAGAIRHTQPEQETCR